MHLVKQIIIGLLIPAAVLILIFGPAQETVRPADRQADVVIHYWEKWVGEEETKARVIVDDFNNTVGKQKHIFVDYLSMSDINHKTLIATAAGVPPDVAGLWDGNLIQYSSLDAFEPLEDLAAAHGITGDYYKPAYWDACHWGGHLYALVSTPATIALHYNTRIFHENADKLRAAGLDPDRAPQTIDELDRYAEVLNTFTVSPDGRKHLDRAGYLPMEPGWYITSTPLWFGGDVWDPKTEQFTLTSPACLAAWTWIQGYSKRLGNDVLTEFSSGTGGFNSPQNPFLADKVVMEQQGPWMALYINKFKPSMAHDWAAAPFPSGVPGKPGVTLVNFDTLSIPRGCKHKAEAFEFIAFVNRQDEMEKLCSSHCKNSPLNKVSPEFIKNHPNPYIQVFEDLARSPNAHISVRCPIAPEASDEISNMTQEVVLLKKTPEQALRETQDLLQKKYQEFKTIQQARSAEQ